MCAPKTGVLTPLFRVLIPVLTCGHLTQLPRSSKAKESGVSFVLILSPRALKQWPCPEYLLNECVLRALTF